MRGFYDEANCPSWWRETSVPFASLNNPRGTCTISLKMNWIDSLVIDSVWILRSKEWSYYEKETRVVREIPVAGIPSGNYLEIL